MTMPSAPRPDPGRTFDVAIAGAGLAGASLALRLARAGADVALIEAASFPREKLCGEFLSPECWGVFDRLGVSADLGRAGFHAVRRVALSTPGGRVVEADFTGPDGEPGIGLSRSVLDDLLVRRAREAGTTVLERVRVGGPLLEGGRVAGLRARGPSGELPDVRARVTVAADGRHSGLVRRTGATRVRSRFRPGHFGLKRHLRLPGGGPEPEGTVGLHLLPGGYVGTCRIDGGQTNLCGLLPESVLRRHRGQLDALAATTFDLNPALGRIWAAAEPSGEWKTVAGVRVEASRPRLPGILYAGDCQGTVDPLGGQGMTMALLGAEVLAPIVLRALASGGADRPLQRAYDREWHGRFDRRIRLCRLFHHVLVNPGVVDLLSACSSLAPRLLALGFASTRDARTARGLT